MGLQASSRAETRSHNIAADSCGSGPLPSKRPTQPISQATDPQLPPYSCGSGPLPAKRPTQPVSQATNPQLLPYSCGSGSLPAKRPTQPVSQATNPQLPPYSCGSGSLPAKRPTASQRSNRPTTPTVLLWERVSAREKASSQSARQQTHNSRRTPVGAGRAASPLPAKRPYSHPSSGTTTPAARTPVPWGPWVHRRTRPEARLPASDRGRRTAPGPPLPERNPSHG